MTHIPKAQLDAAMSAVPKRSTQARLLLSHLFDHRESTSRAVALATGITNLSNTTRNLNRHLKKVGLFVACVRPLTPEPSEWLWSVYPLQGGAYHG